MATVEPPKNDVVDRHELREEYLFAGASFSHPHGPHPHSSHPNFWERFFAFWPWTKGGTEMLHKHSSSDFFHPLSEAELLSIYGKLHKCCDDGEQELKEAIGYGQHVVLEKKHMMEISRQGRRSDDR